MKRYNSIEVFETDEGTAPEEQGPRIPDTLEELREDIALMDDIIDETGPEDGYSS